MKFPSEYTFHFAISNSDNGFVLYYEDEIIDLNSPTTKSTITKSRIYPETLEGQKELLEDIVELMGWYPANRKDGLTIEIKKLEVF